MIALISVTAPLIHSLPPSLPHSLIRSPLEVVRESEGGEDGVLAGERDERRRGEGAVGVDPRQREPQRVLLA